MAARLGIANVQRDILDDLTAEQLIEWEQYARLEPFDEVRADYRTAQIAWIIACANRDPKKPVPKLDEFLLKFGEQEEKSTQTPQQQFALLKIMAEVNNYHVQQEQQRREKLAQIANPPSSSEQDVLAKAHAAMIG